MILRMKKYIAICLFGGMFFINTTNEVIAIGKNDTLREESQKFEKPNWVEYDKLVTLKGTVIELNDYGPPNYGENPETDEKVKYCVLKLDTPINVRADSKSNLNTDDFRNECLLQIVVPYDDVKKIRAKLNKKVIITGTLYQRHTGHHYTNVLITVQKIELAEEKEK
jgi:hypothetical protein